MSSSNDESRKRAQAHQNKFAFRHNKHSQLSKKITSLDTSQGLCPRCIEILEWRKKYRKYKMLTELRKCIKCDKKKVKRAYNNICDDCAASGGNLCVKCMKPRAMNTKKSKAEEKAMIETLIQNTSRLRERERRQVLRKLKDGYDLEELTMEMDKMLNGIQVEGSDNETASASEDQSDNGNQNVNRSEIDDEIEKKKGESSDIEMGQDVQEEEKQKRLDEDKIDKEGEYE